ncbi:VPA1262 family protein [Paraburkholderia tropica]|uniref:VPA1262 family protein n=1 Tax=Paraburkholderia tropica TaxID=92647 RepID=UPI002ABE1C56|nr:VPA1262 family protein [Paraburkholderia tropica]
MQLNDILSEKRLARLFDSGEAPCVIEMWILQIKSADSVSSRLVYGRILPSDFANNTWNAQREDSFKPVDESVEAQVKRVTTFVESKRVRNFLALLVEGKSLGEASDSTGIKLSQAAVRFASVTLSNALALRPVMHLPSRDYFLFRTKRLSQASHASMDSAAVTCLSKGDMFSLDGYARPALAKLVTEALKAGTGLDFSHLDAWRLGDVELGVFPALDDAERQLVKVQTLLKSDSPGIQISIAKDLLSGVAGDVEIELQLLNDDCAFYVARTKVSESGGWPQEVWLDVPAHQVGIVDALTVLVETREHDSVTSLRRFQWGAYLVREVGMQMQMQGNVTRVNFDWLKIALHRSHTERLEAAQTLSRNNHTSHNVVGGRKADPWVTANRLVVNVTSKLVPPVSEARFLERYSEGDNTGRLALAEWLKRLFAAHQDKHILWFDPFMEDVGVTLINQYGFTNGSYVIFTHALKPQAIDNWYEHILHRNAHGHIDDEPDTPVGTRVSRLVSACKAWNRQMTGVRLQVVGLPEETLHDRMIVIRNAKMEPVMGFHLSNSIQKANENFPLLITPIPFDVLRQVCDYSDRLLKRVAERAPDVPREGVDAMVLFDSNDEPKIRETGSRPDLFSMQRAGDLLSWWTGYDSLTHLTGDALKSLLQELSLLDENERLHAKAFDHVPEKFWSHGQDVFDTNAWWDAMGTLLAHSPAGTYVTELSASAPAPNDALSNLLVEYLRPDRADAIQPLHSGPIADTMKEMQGSHEELLKTYRSRHFAYRERFTMLSWGDQYALKVLWHFAPQALVRWMEQQAVGPGDDNRRRQLLLFQAISHISIGTGFGCSNAQLDALLSSSNHYVQWLGFVALETLLQDDHKLLPRVQNVGHLSQVQKACVLGWLLARSDRGATPLRIAIIGELHQTLPKVVDKCVLDALLDSMRNPLGRIYEANPWILTDVIAPLVEAERLSPDDVAQAWVDELFSYWQQSESRGSLLFDVQSEGVFTEQIAALLLCCSSSRQKKLLKRFSTEVDSIHRTVTQIFAHQVDYSRTRDEYHKAMWIGIVGRLMFANGSGPAPRVQAEEMGKIHTKTTGIVNRTNWSDSSTVERSLLQYWKC